MEAVPGRQFGLGGRYGDKVDSDADEEFLLR